MKYCIIVISIIAFTRCYGQGDTYSHYKAIEGFYCSDSTFYIGEMEGKLGLLNDAREPISEFIYSEIRMLGNDVIKAKVDGMLHLFNCQGKLITPIKYKDVIVYYNPDLKGRYFVKNNEGLVGMIDDDGNVLIPNEFDRLDPISHHKQVYGRKKDKIYHYDYSGNLVYLKEIH